MKTIVSTKYLRALPLFSLIFLFPHSILFGQGVNLVLNPGFENANSITNFIPPTPPDFIRLSGTNTLNNWEVVGLADLHGFAHRYMGVAPSVGNHIDLNADGGKITQTINGLVPSTSYILKFLVSLHRDATCTPNSLRIQFGGFSEVMQLSGSNIFNWVMVTRLVTPLAASQVLTFTSGGCSTIGGPLIDEVSISANSDAGINESINQTVFTAFPNPVKDILHISLNQHNAGYEIEVISLIGQTLLKTQNNSSIDVSQLCEGIYFIKVSNGNKYYQQKFIKR
ncbi:MAG: T9SS type A sorting domain-containing protein [Bacteroidota bacterium]|nr:T9SS type A sorting domain-containing protein [Bacteroidota bacterium]